MQLRPYQRQSLDSLYAYWRAGKGNGLIVLPTGSGKSLVCAQLCRELTANYPGLRIGITTHVKELIQQNHKELLTIWPHAPAGIYSAGIGRRDTQAQILFCGIQSVWRKVKQIGGFDVLIIDEAHLVSHDTETTYGKFIRALQEEVTDMRVVGLTATPYRLSTGALHKGKGRLFDDIVYDANVADLIEQGYLAPLISKATAQTFDTSGVAKRGGEFIAKDLEVSVDHDWITRAAAEEMVRYGEDRRAWLAFCCGVKHAEHIRDAIREHGISCEMVTGETPKGERDRIIGAFRNGHIRCLTSVGVIATGFNVPFVDLISLLRPTMSAGLFCQQVGRGLRKAPGKENCLVLDFAGLTKKHGPIDCISVSTAAVKTKDEREAPLAKECPHCHTLVALAARTCPTCGHEFPYEEQPKHEAVADANSSILSKGEAVWVDVDSVHYYRHEKVGSQPSIRVEYRCGFTVHKQWVCLSHSGLARSKAEQWWVRAGDSPVPRTTDDGLKRARELKAPSQIQVRPSGKYFEVVGRRFEMVGEVA